MRALPLTVMLTLAASCMDSVDEPAPTATLAAAAADDEEAETLRQHVPVDADDPQLGPADAPITIVLFVDFECAYSRDGFERARALVAANPGDVRLVIKQRPLPGHLFARDAARAALAAHALGRFDAMADALFADRAHLQRADLQRQARGLGLDAAAFDRWIASDQTEAAIRADLRLAEQLGVTGTPAWFVNGVYFPGRLDDERAAAIIASERAYVDELRDRGVARADIYRAVTGGGAPRRVAPAPAPAALDAHARYRVELTATELAIGPADALATVVVFGDVTCPRTRRAWQALRQRQVHDPSLRIVWRHDPLPQHADAVALHQLVVGAQALGRGPELLDAILAHAPTVPSALGAAALLGIDPVALRAAASAATTVTLLQADRRQAAQLAVRGTPTMFVNGTPLEGWVGEAALAQTIAAEAERARALPAGATPTYARAIADGRASAAPATPRVRPPIPDLAPPVAVAIAPTDPQRGAAGAPVTVVAYMDFECPYSAEAAATLDRLRARHGDGVRVVFKHLPLAMHDDARNAAAAALAAQQQGRFWEMHDWLFAHQGQLDRVGVEAGARALGLDLARFRRDFDDPAVTDRPILAAEAEGRALGFTGTPTLVVNGQVVPGMIDEPLLDELITGAGAAVVASR